MFHLLFYDYLLDTAHSHYGCLCLQIAARQGSQLHNVNANIKPKLQIRALEKKRGLKFEDEEQDDT